MSFYCPHYDAPSDRCLRVRCICVPGRRGCVLRGKAQFLVDPEERLAERLREIKGDRPASREDNAG